MIVVIGPGALGLLFAARLAAGGTQVSILDHDQQRAISLANHIKLTTTDQGTLHLDIPISADPTILAQAKTILVCVKSAQIKTVLATIAHQAMASPLVIGLQNGIAHLPFWQQPTGLFSLGVTAQGATLLEPGHCRHGGDGITYLGYVGDQQDKMRLAQIAKIFSACHLPTAIEKDIIGRLWRKLIINCGINGLTALYDCPNGQLLTIQPARDRLQRLVTEASTVALAQGITIGPDPLAETMATCQATANNISSMLQDIRAGRPTEIKAINGALVDLAATNQIPVPENSLLVQQITTMEEQRKKHHDTSSSPR